MALCFTDSRMSGHTRLIEDATVREDDEELLRVITQALAASIEGVTMFQIAIANEAGHPYRYVEVYGLNQLVRVNEALQRMGFVDQAPNDGGKVRGYDSLFVKHVHG